MSRVGQWIGSGHPDPAPQAAAWERALRVIYMESTRRVAGVTRSRAWRSGKRGRAASKGE